MPDNWRWYYCCIEGLGTVFAELPSDQVAGEACVARRITEFGVTPDGRVQLRKWAPIMGGLIRGDLDVAAGALLWLAPCEKLLDDLAKLWGKVQAAPASVLHRLDSARRKGSS